MLEKTANKLLVETRNYIPRQTAFYAHWLLFEKEATFREFLEAFPHHALDARLAKTAEERDALAADLDRRRLVAISISVAWGRAATDKSCATIRRASDKIRQPRAQFRLLETAKALATEWEDRL